jgi:hypothetical protein
MISSIPLCCGEYTFRQLPAPSMTFRHLPYTFREAIRNWWIGGMMMFLQVIDV